MGKLREQMKGDLELKGLSPNTQEIYIRQVNQFSRHFKRSPLKVTDIDSKRMLVRIKQGKGRKDRYTILSKAALEVLREYWGQYRPKEWLFAGRFPGFIGISTLFQKRTW